MSTRRPADPTEAERVEVTGRQIILEMMTHAARHTTLQELAHTLLIEYSADMIEAGLGEKYGSVQRDGMDITWCAEETYGAPANCLTFDWTESCNDGSRDYGTIRVPFGWITGRAEWIEAEKVRRAAEYLARQTKQAETDRAQRDARIVALQAEIDSLRALQGPQ